MGDPELHYICKSSLSPFQKYHSQKRWILLPNSYDSWYELSWS
jgi:hypothetical protein